MPCRSGCETTLDGARASDSLPVLPWRVGVGGPRQWGRHLTVKDLGSETDTGWKCSPATNEKAEVALTLLSCISQQPRSLVSRRTSTSSLVLLSSYWDRPLSRVGGAIFRRNKFPLRNKSLTSPLFPTWYLNGSRKQALRGKRPGFQKGRLEEPLGSALLSISLFLLQPYKILVGTLMRGWEGCRALQGGLYKTRPACCELQMDAGQSTRVLCDDSNVLYHSGHGHQPL